MKYKNIKPSGLTTGREIVKMIFNDLPDEIIHKIYKHAYSESVLPDVKKFKLSKLNRVHPEIRNKNKEYYNLFCCVIVVERSPYYY